MDIFLDPTPGPSDDDEVAASAAADTSGVGEDGAGGRQAEQILRAQKQWRIPAQVPRGYEVPIAINSKEAEPEKGKFRRLELPRRNERSSSGSRSTRHRGKRPASARDDLHEQGQAELRRHGDCGVPPLIETQRRRCQCRCNCSHRPRRLIRCVAPGRGVYVGPGCCATNHQVGAPDGVCHLCAATPPSPPPLPNPQEPAGQRASHANTNGARVAARASGRPGRAGAGSGGQGAEKRSLMGGISLRHISATGCRTWTSMSGRRAVWCDHPQ